MKYFLLFLFSILLLSCAPNPVKEYRFQVEYNNGQVDTITWEGQGENYFRLQTGDLWKIAGADNFHVIVSGIRNYKTISISYKKTNLPVRVYGQ